MKRGLLLGLVLTALLFGCGERAAEQAEATPAATVAPTATAQPTATAEPVLLTMAPTEAPTPTPTAPPTPSPTPTVAPTPTLTPGPTPFSLVLLPDTQAMAYFKPEAFPQLRDWIEENRESRNILGILHTGDIVDNGFKEWQWDNFAPLLEAVHDGLFFFPVAGNHDIGTQAKSFAAYLKRPFLDDYPQEQKFEGGKALYRVLSAGGDEVLLLGMSWDVYKSRAALTWIDQVLADHAGMPCILITHGFFLSTGGYIPAMEQLIAQRPAIRLVFCGHARGYQTQAFSYDDDGDGFVDRTVTVAMLNLQEGQYAFRLLTFDPVTHALAVDTFGLDGAPVSDIPGMGPISFTLEQAY